MSKKVENPCISLCHLKHDVCTGRGRSKDKIKGWKGMKRKEQKIAVERAAARLKDIRKKAKMN
ncbi:DUF1289 domain-containing protein [Herbaspirillum sp.]|uniref:DUF1289 domain-containing protein n=1 Tax=Herbaspirillum sp. TaxID=1890675 RepID=UPI0031D07C80